MFDALSINLHPYLKYGDYRSKSLVTRTFTFVNSYDLCHITNTSVSVLDTVNIVNIYVCMRFGADTMNSYVNVYVNAMFDVPLKQPYRHLKFTLTSGNTTDRSTNVCTSLMITNYGIRNV